jgi:hypothetical protein
MEDLVVDQNRNQERFLEATGIYIRAKLPITGEWGSHDIAMLTCASLKTWLQSCGGENAWAEMVVAMLLGHTKEDIRAAWSLPVE